MKQRTMVIKLLYYLALNASFVFGKIEMMVNGTLNPTLMQQLFSIHGRIENAIVPLMFGLMKSKIKVCYKLFFWKLCKVASWIGTEIYYFGYISHKGLLFLLCPNTMVPSSKIEVGTIVWRRPILARRSESWNTWLFETRRCSCNIRRTSANFIRRGENHCRSVQHILWRKWQAKGTHCLFTVITSKCKNLKCKLSFLGIPKANRDKIDKNELYRNRYTNLINMFYQVLQSHVFNINIIFNVY